MTNATTPSTQTELDPDFDDLESLLAESLQAQQEKDATKAARERLKRGGLSTVERAADEARIADWEARHEWRDEANVRQYLRYECACGASHLVFEQYMVRQRHRTLRDSQRWQQAQTAPSPHLPFETVARIKSTPLCGDCTAIDLTHATIWS